MAVDLWAQNIAQTWPFIYVLAYAAVVPFASKSERFLFHALALFLSLVFVTMPHTGGAQWSPRFFLAATPLGAIIAVQLLQRAGGAGRQHAASVVPGVAALATSVAVQVYGLTYLATFKSINASITRGTAARALPGDLIVSDLYWFPEVTATLYPTHRLLFAPSAIAVGRIAERALSTGSTHFWVAASTPLTRYSPARNVLGRRPDRPFGRGPRPESQFAKLVDSRRRRGDLAVLTRFYSDLGRLTGASGPATIAGTPPDATRSHRSPGLQKRSTRPLLPCRKPRPDSQPVTASSCGEAELCWRRCEELSFSLLFS